MEEDITNKIIEIFYYVYNELGYGFLEKVYERAMCVAFRNAGIKFVSQFPVKVIFEGEVVGNYIADFLIEDRVVVGIKASRELCGADEFQLINYLKCTDKEVGLLLNFGKRPQIKRKVFDNVLKKKYQLLLGTNWNTDDTDDTDFGLG